MMEDICQLAGLGLVALGIDYSINRLSGKQQIVQKKDVSYITAKTVQTYNWIYSDVPKSLLFDFSNVASLKAKDAIISVVKWNIPSQYHTDLVQKSDRMVELCIGKSSLKESFVSQLLSILEYKGLFIKTENIWLKPTLTIPRQLQNHYIYWHVSLLDIPFLRLENYQYKLKLQLICLLENVFTSKKLYSEQQQEQKGDLSERDDMVFIDINQIYFQKCHTKKTMAAHLLVQENHTTTVVNPSRQLVYAPFLQRHVPIRFKLVE